MQTSLDKITMEEKAKTLKKHYQKPVLKIYGSVKHLTQAKGGSLNDGASGMNML